MRPYPKYKLSVVHTVGTIPDRWNSERLKFHVGINRRTLEEDTDPNKTIKYIDIGNVSSDGKVSEIQDFRFADAPSRARRILVGGDTIISTVRTYLKAIAHFDKPPDDLICSTGFAVLSCSNGLVPKYLFYQVNASYFIDEIVSRSVGVSYPAINALEIGNLFCLVPPLPEQQAIATYLDDKTRKIDTLIEKKQRLIELLKEQRTAIINQAVTKGINPKVKMKDSGIEWIGEIPEHWRMKRLKYVAMLQNSNVDKKTSEVELNVLLCNYLDVYQHESIDDSISFMEATASAAEIEKFKIQVGDVLVTKDSETPDDIAVPSLVVADLTNVICGYHLAQIRPINHILLGEYLFRLFQSKRFNGQFEVGANGVTRFGLGVSTFADAVIPLPDLKEQSDIAEYIKRMARQIDETIATNEKAIELLHEYRTALISEVVTGKIDVRYSLSGENN